MRPAQGGAIDLAGLPEGTYFVSAVDRLPEGSGISEDAWQDPELLERAARKAVRVTLQQGQTVSVTLRR